METKFGHNAGHPATDTRRTGDLQSKTAATRSLHVLIVEDESLVSMFLEDVVTDLGHRIAGCAPSAGRALMIAAECQANGIPIDVALVDIGLSGNQADGVDAAIALREQHGVPAFLMTGAAYGDLSTRAQRARPLGYLMKPYTEDEVNRALKGVIDQLDDPATGIQQQS